MELGITTFAETHPVDGVPVAAAERLRQVVAEVELAEQVGLDVYGVGEHHRPDFAAAPLPSCWPPPCPGRAGSA